MPLIDIDKLRVTRNHSPICQVSRLTIEHGNRVGIWGSNGSGKTTLLRVLAGLERYFEGNCQIQLSRRDRVYVDQAPYLFRGTVLFNAIYGLRARGLNRQTAESQAMHWLEKLGVQDLAHARVHRLSGGERRRTALAQAMAIRSKLLLLDEPFSDMDVDGRVRIEEALLNLTDTTVILASPTPLSEDFCHQIYELDSDR